MTSVMSGPGTNVIYGVGEKTILGIDISYYHSS
jgi:hypothetical protein